MEGWTAPSPVLLHLLYKGLMSEWCNLTHVCPNLSCFPLLFPSFSAPYLFPSFYPSLEGEESGRFIKAPVWGSGQEKASLPAFIPSHPRSLACRPGRRGNRSGSASAPPSPPRPLRFLPHGVTGASWFLSHRERHVRGHRAGAFAQEVRFSGHQFPQVSPGNPGWQRTDGSPAWAQTLVEREVSTWSNPHRKWTEQWFFNISRWDERVTSAALHFISNWPLSDFFTSYHKNGSSPDSDLQTSR